MGNEIITPFPYHLQDCKKHCGPACILMMLQSQKCDTGKLSQAQILERIRKGCADASDSGCEGLSSPPHLLARAANELLKELATGETPHPQVAYAVFSPPECLPDQIEPGEEKLVCPLKDKVDVTWTTHIRQCIETTGAPVFGLYDRGAHWVTFYGSQAAADEREFLFWSPSGTGTCPPATNHKSDCPGCTPPLDYKRSESDIQDFFFGPVDFFNSGQWACRRALVAPYHTDDPPPWVKTGYPDDLSGMTAQTSPGSYLRRGWRRFRRRLRILLGAISGGISARSAVRLARSSARSSPYLKSRLGIHMEQAHYPGAIKVFHPDGAGDAYYLVPLMTSADSTQAFALKVVDARTGDVRLTASLAPAWVDKSPKPSWLDEVADPRTIAAKALTLKEESLHGRPEPTGRFVWKCCDQSLSPLWPFIEVKHNGQIQWMDLNGIIHARLTRIQGGL